MYLYFDNAGTLKEIFTADPTRQGASDWNKIHSYWESTSGTITGCLIRYARPDVNPFDENAVSIEVAYNTKGNAELPYDSKKDVKFFEYFKNYYFYNFVIPDTVLGVEGPVIATIYYIVSIDGVSTTIPMGMFTFQVEPNATQKVKYDDYISISQWNYLVERLSNLEDGFIQGDHTLDGDITYNGDVVFSNTASATFYCPTTFEGISVSITNVDFTFTDSNSTIAGGPLTIYGSIYFDEDYYVKFGNLLDIDGENGTILPITNNSTELGSSSKRFKKIYAADIDANSITVNNSVKSNLNPSLSNYFNLGGSNKKWAKIYGVELNVDGVNTNLVPTGATQTLGVKNGYWWAGVYADDAVFTDVDIQGTLKTNSGTGLRIEGGLLPKTSGAYNVGSSTLQWDSVYSVAGIFSASLNANSGELTVSSNNTVIKHLTVQNSLTVPITPTFSNGAYISGNITDGTYTWSVADVAGVLALFGTDADSVVNKINEVLDIFENYPEGDDLVSVLASKFDKSNILTAYSDTTSNTTVYSSLVVKNAIDTLNGYFDASGIALRADSDENGDNIVTTYLKKSDVVVSGNFVTEINGYAVAQEVNVSGQPIPVSSTDDMTDETKMYWLTTDGYIYYYDGNDWTQTSQKLFDPSSSLIPAINHDISLGSDSKRWLSGYFNELYVGSQGNNVFSIDDESNIVFNNQPTFNDGIKVASGEDITDGTHSISVEEIVNDKANVEDLENGTLIPSKSLSAKAIENVSEESGTIQESPFINQGTGTANNTDIVDTSPVGKQLEKQGNTIVYNQLARELSSSYWTTTSASATYSDGIATFTASATDGSIYQSNLPIQSGHKYYVSINIKLTTATNQVQVYVNGGYGTANTIATTNLQTLQFIFTGHAEDVKNLTVRDRRTSDWDAVQVKDVYVIDLTQWFNGDIPQDLLDNPSHWSWYYNGSLSYNVGELRNCAGRYLVCGGRNVWDEQWERGYYNNNGVKVSGSGLSICSTNLFRIIPNSTYYNKSGGNYFNMFFYDSNRDFIKVQSVNINATFTTPENACYMAFHLGGDYGITYKNDITISLYYTTGEGYNDYYAYESPKVYDTGTETLRKVGSVKDIKKPDGTIHRLVGSVDLSTLEWIWDGSGAYYETSISGFALPQDADTKGNITHAIYENRVASGFSGTGANGIALVVTGYLRVKTSDAGVTPTGTLYYELATPTTEQGTPFSENIEINDYGTMLWQDTSNNLVAIPQGTKLFYPADYVLLIDSLNTYVNGDATKLALKTDVSTEATARSNQDTILLNAIGGTLRQCLCVKETLDFENTAFIDLGSLNWSYNASYGFSAQLSDAKNIGYDTNAKILSTLYKTNTYVNVAGKTSDMQIALGGYDISQPPLILINNNSYTNATTFKNAMKGILLAYEKA